MRVTTLLMLFLIACGGQERDGGQTTGGRQESGNTAGPHGSEDSPHLTTTTTPEGVTFTVPAGFSYAVRADGTTRAYVMKSGTSTVVVGVFPFTEGTCQATFQTARGLPGCAEEQQVQGGSRAGVIIHSGPLAVGVLTAAADTSALQLARTVADTVLIPAPLPTQNANATGAVAPDERFFGCFSQSSSFMDVSAASSMCLYQDGTFRYRSIVRAGSYDPVSRDETSAAYGDTDDAGRWWVEPIDVGDGKQHWNLHLIFDDGREATWQVRFYNGDLVRGDTDLWKRT